MASRTPATSDSRGRQSLAGLSKKAALPDKPTLREILDADLSDLRVAIKERDLVLPEGLRVASAGKTDCQMAIFAHFGYPAHSTDAASAAKSVSADVTAQIEQAVLRALQQAVPQAVQQAVQELIKPVSDRIPALENKHHDLQAKVTALQGEKRELHSSLSFLNDQVTQLQQEVRKSRFESAVAADAPAQLLRKPNLTMSRLPDVTSQESAETAVSDLLTAVGVTESQSPRK